MNFSQKLGLFILIVISITYVYFAFFKDVEFNIDTLNKGNTNVQETKKTEHNNSTEPQEVVKELKNIKIFISDSKGNIRPVNRECDIKTEKSCFVFAMNELINAPTKWEKSKGFSSEIPQNTKILSIREGSSSIMLDLSSGFETGGGTASTYQRIRQVIKTANANTDLPVYLYINGRQANVIGGDGIMIKQPLNERSIDD